MLIAAEFLSQSFIRTAAAGRKVTLLLDDDDEEAKLRKEAVEQKKQAKREFALLKKQAKRIKVVTERKKELKELIQAELENDGPKLKKLRAEMRSIRREERMLTEPEFRAHTLKMQEAAYQRRLDRLEVDPEFRKKLNEQQRKAHTIARHDPKRKARLQAARRKSEAKDRSKARARFARWIAIPGNLERHKAKMEAYNAKRRAVKQAAKQQLAAANESLPLQKAA